MTADVPPSLKDLVALAIAGDKSAVRRIRDEPGVAAALAKIIVTAKAEAVVFAAAAKLARRKRDPAAIAAMKRVLLQAPAAKQKADAFGIELVAIALAERKEPAATTAAMAAYRVLPNGRSKFFIAQTLANRTERDKVLRSRNDVAAFFAEIALGRLDERADAVWALWKCANPRTVPALMRLLRSSDQYQREMAAEALTAISRR